MNIYEKLKNDRKNHWREKQEATTRNLDPVIVDLPLHHCDNFYWMRTIRNLDPVIVNLTYTPMTISTGCSNVHFDHQNAKVLHSKFNPFGLCEIEWFP